MDLSFLGHVLEGGEGVAHGRQCSGAEVRGQLSAFLSFILGTPGVIRLSLKHLYTLSHLAGSVYVYLMFQTRHKQFESGQSVHRKTIAKCSGVAKGLRWASNSKTEKQRERDMTNS